MDECSLEAALSYSSFKSHRACNISPTAAGCKGVTASSCVCLWSWYEVAQPSEESMPASGLDFDFPICEMETKPVFLFQLQIGDKFTSTVR